MTNQQDERDGLARAMQSARWPKGDRIVVASRVASLIAQHVQSEWLAEHDREVERAYVRRLVLDIARVEAIGATRSGDLTTDEHRWYGQHPLAGEEPLDRIRAWITERAPAGVDPDSELAGFLPCKHWNASTITYRRGCTACEAEGVERVLTQNGDPK